MVVFGQKWLYSGKDGCIRANWLYSGIMVVYVQGGCIWAKLFVFGKKCLYLGKSGCYRVKVVVFGIKKVVFG